MQHPNITELSAIAVIFIFFLKEIFAYLKHRATPTEPNGVLEELKLMNNNHLHSIEKAILQGNEKMIKTMYECNQKQIEFLARIEGKLK